MKKPRGFTLIELMIVVLVIAVLAGIALSSYNNQVRKSRRSEAKQVLSDLSLRQEKYRSNNTTYGTCDQAMNPSTCAALNTSVKYYTFALTSGSNTASGYVFTATPLGDQLNDSCGTLTFTMALGVIDKDPDTAGCW